MANWSEKLNKFTQTAISKGKEVTEITKLNVEVVSLNQNLKEIATKIGQYVLEHELLVEEEAIAELMQQAKEVKANIEANQKKILEAKNAQLCSSCGAEVSKNSKFCDKCGAEIIKVEVQPAEEVVVEKKCQNCGALLAIDAVFCGECGAKQE